MKGWVIQMTKWPEKKLGFGLMRLPKDANKEIEMNEFCQMVDAFMADGFTYFDTAYIYDGSEVAFRKAVVERYPRESFTVASKLAAWQLTDTFRPADMFNESLSRCGVEYFDYYLLHSLQESHGTIYEDNGCWEFVEQMKAEGKIRHLGFSFHGSPALLEKLLTEHPDVDFVQLQLNYVDWDNEIIASGKNYEICCKHGKEIVVMEPIKGGLLANIKPEARACLDACDPSASSASYALRFVASLPGVKVVLSGMSTLQQLEDNVSVFKDFNPLSPEEEAAVKAAGDIILNAPIIPCTSCHYCEKGCPMSIRIPDIFKRYNMLITFGEHFRPHGLYRELIAAGSGRAGDCVKCGQCEAACPQHINIIEQLSLASEKLD